MRRHDYLDLFDRLAETGLDRRVHWASGPRAGSVDPWDGDPESLPGRRSRLYGAACVETEEGIAYAETLMGQPRLLILGGGHVGAAVAAIGGTLGFRVTVVDERRDFADASRLPGADEVICGPYAETIAQLPPYANSYVVIVTPGHALDRVCAEVCLTRPFEYLGMIGSRGKVATVRAAMAEAGFTQEQLDSMHAPIGLPLGGREPAEIAVAILAEIIQVRSARAAALFDPEVRGDIRALADEPSRPAVLATIIGHGGSVPRGTGSRMLIAQQGLLSGSVGGGAVEGAVLDQATRMLTDLSGGEVQLVDHDLSDREGAELGMICGGRVRVVLERL